MEAILGLFLLLCTIASASLETLKQFIWLSISLLDISNSVESSISLRLTVEARGAVRLMNSPPSSAAAPHVQLVLQHQTASTAFGRLATMVYYFTSTVTDPKATIYVGKDKFESMLIGLRQKSHAADRPDR